MSHISLQTGIYYYLLPVAMVTALERTKILAIFSAPVGCHGLQLLQASDGQVSGWVVASQGQ
jgi:hypothetical protein